RTQIPAQTGRESGIHGRKTTVRCPFRGTFPAVHVPFLRVNGTRKTPRARRLNSDRGDPKAQAGGLVHFSERNASLIILRPTEILAARCSEGNASERARPEMARKSGGTAWKQ